MDYDEAFWRLVDVVNLERHVTGAEARLAGAEAKIEKARAHLADAEHARGDAEAALGGAHRKLAVALERAAEIPPEIAAAAAVDVDARNAVREVIVRALAQVAEGTGEAGRATAIVRAAAGHAAAEGEALQPGGS